MTFLQRFSDNSVVTLTDAATIAIDLSTGPHFMVTLAGNRTLANPTSDTAIKELWIAVKQDATGGRTLAFADNWVSADPSVTLATTANAVSIIFAIGRNFGSGVKWYYTVTQASESSGITDLTGDVTASGSGSVATTIATNVVSNSKLAQVATATFKGRTSGGTGNPEDLTATQATALLSTMVGDSGAGGTKGLVGAPAAGDAAAGKFWKADGTWTAPTATVADASITAAKLDVLLTVVFTAYGISVGTGLSSMFPADQDTVTLSANTTYMFECFLDVLRDGSTNASVKFNTGTAGISSINYISLVKVFALSASPVSTITQHIFRGSSANQTTITAAASTVVSKNIIIKGVIRTSTSGTFKPEIAFSAAATDYAEVQIGSYFKLTPIGSDTTVKVGAWA